MTMIDGGGGDDDRNDGDGDSDDGDIDADDAGDGGKQATHFGNEFGLQHSQNIAGLRVAPNGKAQRTCNAVSQHVSCRLR